METADVWQNILFFLRNQPGVVALSGGVTAESLMAAGGDGELCVSILAEEDGKVLQSFLQYEHGQSRLSWTVHLLPRKKDRREFSKLLRDSGKRALEYFLLSAPFFLANLRLGNVNDGPILQLTQDVGEGISDRLCHAMLREMRCAIIIHEKIIKALDGYNMRQTFHDFIRFNCFLQPDEENEQCSEETLCVSPIKQKNKNDDIPQRVLDISSAIKNDDVKKAHSLAAGEDLADIPFTF